MSNAIERAQADLEAPSATFEFADEAIDRASLSRDFPVPPHGYAYIVTASAVTLIRVTVVRFDVEHERSIDGSRRGFGARLEPQRTLSVDGSVLGARRR